MKKIGCNTYYIYSDYGMIQCLKFPFRTLQFKMLLLYKLQHTQTI